MLISESIIEIINKYLLTINNFTKFFFNNITVYKSISYLENLYIKGITLINNIYSTSLLYLDNLVDIYNLCEKGYVYFVEFVNQINLSNSGESTFDLTLKDAIIFSYKKTIFNFDSKILTDNNDYEKNKLKIINHIIYIINKLNIISNNRFYYLLDYDTTNKYKNENDYKDLLKKINEKIGISTTEQLKIIKKMLTNLELNTLLSENNNEIYSYLITINNVIQLIINNLDNIKFNNNNSYKYISNIKNIIIFLDKYISKRLYVKNINNEYIIDNEFVEKLLKNESINIILNNFK